MARDLLVTQRGAESVWEALEAVEAQRKLVLETKGDQPQVLARRVSNLVKLEAGYADLIAELRE